MNVDALISEALSWEGTPWHHQAAIKGAGIDCAMFLVRCYQAAGVVPAEYDPRPYPRDWHLPRSEERFVAEILKHARRVRKPRAGDRVLYKFGRCHSHGGIVLEWPIIIHSYVTRGVCRDHGDQGDLAGRDMRVYRIKGV